MRSTRLALALAALIAIQPFATHAASAAAPAKRPLSYAQLLAEHLLFENPRIAGVALYAPDARTGRLAEVAQTWPGAPRPGTPALEAAFRRGETALTEDRESRIAILPLHDDKGATIGALVIALPAGDTRPRDAALGQAQALRDDIARIIPKAETLADPYMQGYDGGDTLAQAINQILLARHPEAAVIAIHLTAPGDARNKVWGINRPNFILRDSDEIDTDTEKTGRIVMQVIPATHRMEVHMPLLSRRGERVGTLCTVYFWKSLGEAADYYGRSLSMMEEARLLVPDDRDALFRPVAEAGALPR